MADEPISALSTLASYNSGDYLEVLDVTDTTFAPTGTNKKVTVPNFLSNFIAAGSNISIAVTGNGISIASTASGTLTSVGLAVPSWLAVSNSPLTSNGTITISAATGQTANQVLAVTSGALAVRALAAADMPAQVVLTTGSYSQPSWLTSVLGSIVSGNISGNAGNVTGTVAPGNGGTGLGTLTAHAVILGEGTSNVGFATIGTAGRLLIDQGASADPSFNALSGDATITSAGVITVSALAITTGKIAAGAVTYAKIQNVAASSILGNPTGSPAAPVEITLGANLSFSGTTLVAASGGLTSVGLAVPSWLAVSGSPLVSNGTITISAATGQTANQFLATPNGSSGAVGLRSIVAADLPTTGLTLNEYTVTLTTDTVAGGAVAPDFSVSANHYITLSHTGSTTVTLTNLAIGQTGHITLKQDGTGGCLATYVHGVATIYWADNVTPTLSTGANYADVLVFWRESTNVIRANVYGLGYTA